FKLKEWVRDVRIVLEKNEDYWGTPLDFRVPKYDLLIDMNVPEATAEKMMLERGDIDLAWEMTVDMAWDYEQHAGAAPVKVYKSPIMIGTSILMNPAHPPFADPNVRRAIRYAIDYDTIINKILRGYAIRMSAPIFAPCLGWVEEPMYDYDLEKAQEYMAKSKYPEGFSFTLEIGTGAGMGAPWETIALKLKEDLAKIGIDMNIHQVDWSVMDEMLFNGKYDAQLNWFGAGYLDPESMMDLFGRTKTSIVLKANAWVNETVDELADQAMVEVDLEKRKALYSQICEIFKEDGANAFIAQQQKVYVVREDLYGLDVFASPMCSMLEWWALYKTDWM
ncbi:MAG: ABC transporter substrate-binding protein, partial [Candidatus Baldrarchaeia archaeon]